MTTITAEQAHLKSIVEAIALYADLYQFAELERLFAPNVLVDYSSLWGEESQTLSASMLITSWAQILPGFTTVKHELQNIVVNVTGDSATAKADVVANHWLDGEKWLVSGSYIYRFTLNETKNWQLAELTFLLSHEQGDRGLIEKAKQRASTNLPDYLRKQQNLQSAKEFLTLLTAKDVDKFLNLWAENGMQDMPFSPGDFPKKVVGKAALTKHWSGVSEFIGRMDFYDIVFINTADPDCVVMQYGGEIEILTTGKLYKNDYLAVIEFDKKGKISRFLEYYDPIRLQEAWGLAVEKVAEMAK